MQSILVEKREESINYQKPDLLFPTPHIHKEIELIYIENGASQGFFDRKNFELSSGDLILVFPNQVHYYEEASLGKYHLLIFTPDLLYGIKNELFNNMPAENVVHLSENSPIPELIFKLCTENEEYSLTEQAGLLNQIVAKTLREMQLKPRLKGDNDTLHNIIDYCEKNFTEEIQLEDVANELHINKYHVSHLLNQKIGTGFNAYINCLRVERACSLLKETDRKTSDIASEVGFGSIRTFNRVFISLMGLPPIQYRKKIRMKKQKKS